MIQPGMRHQDTPGRDNPELLRVAIQVLTDRAARNPSLTSGELRMFRDTLLRICQADSGVPLTDRQREVLDEALAARGPTRGPSAAQLERMFDIFGGAAIGMGTLCVAGLVLGVALGDATLPGLGTILGAFLGAVVGAVRGLNPAE